MWYIYTMQYYSAIKRNKVGSFVETWMEQSEVSPIYIFKRKTIMEQLKLQSKTIKQTEKWEADGQTTGGYD